MSRDDERAVERLILTYARAADRADGPLCRSIFADDAAIDLGTIYKGGPDGFVEVMIGFIGQMAATRHQVTNMLVDVDGDTAAMEAMVTAWHRIETPGGTRALEVYGRYLSRAARQVDGRWLITAHTEVIDWGEDRAADPGWFEANGEMDKGRRDRDDLSYRYLVAVS